MEDPLLANIKLLIRSWKMDAARRRSVASKQTITVKFDDGDQETMTHEGRATLEIAILIEQLTAELEHVVNGGDLP